MITARNYAAQAKRGLMLFAGLPKEHEVDRGFAKYLSEVIHNSTHFVIPDDGEIFDDELKGLRGQRIELPYKSITVEFYSSGKWSGGSRIKIVVAAIDNGDEIIVFGASTDFDLDIWIPSAYSMRVPKDINITGNRGDKLTSSRVVCPGLFEQVGDDESYNHIRSFELCLEELIEALSCKNISTANHQDASPANTKRIKSGKLPIYETKMLVIDTNYSSIGQEGGSVSHSSPRQHLRRGHIRRLPKGNIWVNSCVVGDASKGVINKSYAVM